MAEIIGIHSTRMHGATPKSAAPERLWRDVLGERLRSLRLHHGETLVETAVRAVSPQYLSEVERGRKEPSSEMIAAIAGALDTTLIDLTARVSEDLRRQRDGERFRASVQQTVLVLAA